MDTAVKLPCSETMIVSLILTREIDLLTWKMAGFDFGMSTEVFMTAVIASSGALEVLVPTSNAIELRFSIFLAGVVIGVVPRIAVDVFDDVDKSMWAAMTTALKSVSILPSPEETLLFGWTACSFWAMAA